MQVLIDGLCRAAEMLALLLVLPVAVAQPIGEPTISTRTEVRIVGELADVTTRARIRNDGAASIDLAARLPAIDEHTSALRIHRRGRIIDLLHTGECGDDNESDPHYVAGHARLAFDEAIADALRLAPGETALIETVATQPMTRVGAFVRLAVPAYASAESRAWLVDHVDAPLLIVIADRSARGTARLTLRPALGAAETIELGELQDTPAAFLIPLADHDALTALAGGAIEFEAQAQGYIMWTTIPARLRSGDSLAVVRAPELESTR
jgi:hypothetical protein